MSFMFSLVLHFKAAISLWMDRKLSEYRVAFGSVQPIVVYPIERVRLLSDAVQENILLTVVAPSGQQVTLSFPLALADDLVAELSDLLAEMRAANPIKQ